LFSALEVRIIVPLLLYCEPSAEALVFSGLDVEVVLSND